jgi:DNA-binding Xre family transcriptional regulator
MLSYFTFFSAAIPAAIHYAILRRGHTIRIERMVISTAILLATTAVAGKAYQLHREHQIVMSLYRDWDKDFVKQWETLQKEERYGEMVVLLEKKCESYREEVAALGGLHELVRIAGGPREAFRDGTSDLYCGLDEYIDYNAAFTPMNVESVLMRAMPYQARKTQRLQAFAAQLSQSREPLLKAYGLWMQERHEEYRNYVYQHAELGELWAYGFAADAANNDPDPQRALDMLDRYIHELTHGPYVQPYVIANVLESLDFKIARTAGKLGDVANDTSPRQRVLIHSVLDRSLVTRFGNANTNILSLFDPMGRSDDAKRYLAQIRSNNDQYLRAYMVEMLLQKNMSADDLNQEIVREMHQVLDEHLKTGSTPGITTEQIQRIFRILGRGNEIGTENR